MWMFRSSVPGVAWPAFPSGVPAMRIAIFSQLMHSQWWPAQDLRRWQLRQLGQLVRHAHATVPFYRDRLSHVKDMESVSALSEAWRTIPILKRFDIQTHGEALISASVPKTHGDIADVETSGTTGAPITCKTTTLAKTMHDAMALRSLYWRQWDPQKTFACIRHDGGRGNGGTNGDGKERRFQSESAVAALHTGARHVLGIATGIPAQAEWLARHNPHYLMTYPTNLMRLARYCAEQGIEVSNLESIETASEMVTPEHRRVCEDTWNASVFADYSASETGAIAFQCPQNDHYHIMVESTALEILDDNDAPCRQGEVGRVILTPLHNFAMPLIRYEIGDRAEVGGRCSCGRNLPVLARVLGRQGNMPDHPADSKR